MIGSIQIFLLGFIGEYVMNILYHNRNLPLVIEKKLILINNNFKMLNKF